ncbi:MAG TPA: DUF2911 domain-containing protein [Saprospiraceae bacterium]|nr:DUF2911 domain-containing protein [Saprospiraceae bacterium]
MKKNGLLILLTMLVINLMQAQIKTPAASPGAKVEQRIGLTDMTVEYSRPSVKKRVVFGGLVPYDEVWRTGANAATKITFSEDVNFGGAEVKKGSYALLTKPGKSTWSVMLYPYGETDWTTYGESSVQPVTVSATVYPMAKDMHVESLMMGFDNLSSSSGDFFMLWDNVYVPVTIKVGTDKTVEESIAKVMAGPSSGDYYAAANYYLNEGKDLKTALEWINKSIAMGNEKYWVLRSKSLIQAGLGDKKGAVETATQSLELAKKDSNMDYVRMNEASIAEWKKM